MEERPAPDDRLDDHGDTTETDDATTGATRPGLRLPVRPPMPLVVLGLGLALVLSLVWTINLRDRIGRTDRRLTELELRVESLENALHEHRQRLSALEKTLEPRARFDVVAYDGDTRCGSLLDYCFRLHCTVRNHGDAPGDATVAGRLAVPDGQDRVRDRRVSLEPGQLRRVSFEFPDVDFGTRFEYVCSVDGEG